MSVHGHYDSEENYNYHYSYNDSLNHSYYDDDLEDYYTVCDKSDVRFFASFFLPVVYGLALIVGLVGNSMVVFVYLSLKRRQTLTDVLIVNLAFADLLLLLTLPFWAADAVNGWEIGVVACKITSALYTINFSCSMFLLAYISVDRYKMLARGSRNHTKPPGNRPGRQRLLLSILIWLIAFMFGLPDFFLTTVKQHSSGHKSCRAVYPHNMAQAAKASLEVLEVLVSFLLPFLVMMYCYYHVGKTLSQTATTGMREIRRWKAFQVLIAIVGVFLLTQLPYNIVKLIRTLDIIYTLVTDCKDSKGLDRATQVTESLALTHCCLNPVLYIFAGSSFKVHVLEIAKRCGQTGRHCHQNRPEDLIHIGYNVLPGHAVWEKKVSAMADPSLAFICVEDITGILNCME